MKKRVENLNELLEIQARENAELRGEFLADRTLSAFALLAILRASKDTKADIEALKTGFHNTLSKVTIEGAADAGLTKIQIATARKRGDEIIAGLARNLGV